jgi:hypothetical protein
MEGENFWNMIVSEIREDHEMKKGPYMTEDEIKAFNKECSKDEDKYEEGRK